MKKLIILAILAMTNFACEQPCETSIPEICDLIDLSLEYNPVCGCDGVTYINSGHAMCIGGISDYVDGECGE